MPSECIWPHAWPWQGVTVHLEMGRHEFVPRRTDDDIDRIVERIVKKLREEKP